MPNSKTKSGFLLNIENWFRYRRFPYPKRSVEFVALIAVSCTFFLFMHTKNLNSKLHEMETKLQPSELSALGLSGGNSIINDNAKHHDLKGLHSTYQYLKSTGQLTHLHSNELNNTQYAQTQLAFFNRVAKAGSESMLEFLDIIKKINGFNKAMDKPKKINPRQLNVEQQEELIKEILSLGPNTVYCEHQNWIDFSKFGLPKPIYFNLVRDPVERVISWYFYARSPWKAVALFSNFPDTEIPPEDWYKKDFNTCTLTHDPECTWEIDTIIDTVGDYRRQSLFFCGHNPECLPFNSPRAVQIAKQNVEKEFAVVGSWEETNITLTVLEHYIPRYFTGATEIFYMHYDQITNRNKNKMKPPILEEVKDLIRQNFTQEIEFYDWCKQRLYKQYLALVVDKKIDYF